MSKQAITTFLFAVLAVSAHAYTAKEIDEAVKLSTVAVKCEARGFATTVKMLHVAVALSHGKGKAAMGKAIGAMAAAPQSSIDTWDAVMEDVMDKQFAENGEAGLEFMCGEWLHNETRKFMLRK